LNGLKYTITAIREEMGDNISVLVNCAGKFSLKTKNLFFVSISILLATAHFKDIVSHTDDEYQYTFIVNTLAPILV
jgi:hypothetical protein